MQRGINTFCVNDSSVNFQEVELPTCHQIYYAVAESLKVIFSRLIRILMSSNGGILHSSKEWPLLFLDMDTLWIQIWYGSTEVSDIDLSPFYSEIWRLYISVQLAKSVILLNCIEHLDSNFEDYLVFLLLTFQLYKWIHKVVNTIRQVSHNKEATTFVKGVHDIFRNFGV